MRNNLRTILIVASIALNVAFTATYVSYKLSWLTAMHQQQSPLEPLFLQLDMTADQFARLKSERDTFHARLQKPGREIMEKQTELIDLLAAAPPDHQAIAKKQEEIQHLQGAFQGRIIDHFLRASSILTPVQRTRFFELIKTRIETNGQACPPWMQPVEQGKKGEYRSE
jgi:Spy/CpxP family protein refolding chaperone